VKDGEHLQDPGGNWRIILKTILMQLNPFGNKDEWQAVINTIKCEAFVA
jgi:hypothetical protein